MHCRAIKVKYYPLLPRPQANTAAGEGQQRKNDIMKPKRESKHQASTMCRSASAPGQTFLLVTLTSVLCVCPEDLFFWESFQAQVCYTPQRTAEGSGPLLLFQSWWWQIEHYILTTLP